MDDTLFREKVVECYHKFNNFLRAKYPNQTQVNLQEISKLEYRIILHTMGGQEQYVIWNNRGEPKWGILMTK